MIKVEVIEEFTLGRYDEIKDTLIRKSREEKGKLFVGDIFECTEDMAEYLTKTNKEQRPFIKVIEVIPKEIKKDTKTEIKKTTTKSKKSVAKK